MASNSSHQATASQLPSRFPFDGILWILAGVMQTFTLAPWRFWYFAPLSILLMLSLSRGLDARALRRRGWLFGVGLFGSGVSWVYVSIATYGSTSVAISLFLTALFIAGLALFPALAFWFWGKISNDSFARRLLLLAPVWVLLDALRGWVLTGFPWLYLGTAQVDGPLAGWAPILGVHGVTLLIVATSSLLLFAFGALLQRRRIIAGLCLLVALLPWLSGPLLNQIHWTQRSDKPLRVVTMQGNISQEMKWEPAYMEEQIRIYLQMTRPHWDKDLILWPETAIPLPTPYAEGLFEHIADQFEGHHGVLLTGIPWQGFDPHVGRETFHNSMIALGNGLGIYHKQKLVPFGEYVPLENWLRGLIGFFDLPMSDFTRGPSGQASLRAGDWEVMPFVCYEIAYPDFVARNAQGTGYLVTVSNDGWFGASIAPLQHLQMAQMRALETNRYLLRGTNNGVSALIDEKGRLLRQTPQFREAILEGTLYPVSGSTPFMVTQSWPTLVFSLILIVFFRHRQAA